MSRRAYKPTRLKVLEGTPHKERLNPKEPQPKVVKVKCPKDLDREARKVWRRIEPKLRRLGLMTEVDDDALGILCQIRARLVEIHKFIKEENQSLVQAKVTVDGSGQEHIELKPSPYEMMGRQYYQLFRQYAKEFGLTPAGRVGLSVNTGKGEDDPLGILEDDLG